MIVSSAIAAGRHAPLQTFPCAHRLVVIVLVVFSILWIPVIEAMQGGQLFAYMASFNAAIGPSIAAVYFCAIFWKRANEKVCISWQWESLTVFLYLFVAAVISVITLWGRTKCRTSTPLWWNHMLHHSEDATRICNQCVLWRVVDSTGGM